MNSSNPPHVSASQLHLQARNYEVPLPQHLLCATGESPAEPILPCLCCVRRTTGNYTWIKLVLRFHAAE